MNSTWFSNPNWLLLCAIGTIVMCIVRGLLKFWELWDRLHPSPHRHSGRTKFIEKNKTLSAVPTTLAVATATSLAVEVLAHADKWIPPEASDYHFDVSDALSDIPDFDVPDMSDGFIDSMSDAADWV